MKIKISKKDIYKAMLKHLIDKEEFELAAKVRDTIENIKYSEEETYIIDTDDVEEDK